MRDERDILERVRAGEMSVDDALLALKLAPFADLGYAKVDLHRKLRQGAAEVIYGSGKTPEQILGIVETLTEHGAEPILITRLDPAAAEAVAKRAALHDHADARLGVIGDPPAPDGVGKIVVATGGTSDIPVAEEAALTAETLGSEVVRLYDVGVAGLHRLLAHADEIMDASVVVAVAGMEGAAFPRCSRCSIPAPRACPWSTTTTASARAFSPTGSTTSGGNKRRSVTLTVFARPFCRK